MLQYILYYNVRLLCQAYGELSRACVLYRHHFVCLTETCLDSEDKMLLLDGIDQNMKVVC